MSRKTFVIAKNGKLERKIKSENISSFKNTEEECAPKYHRNTILDEYRINTFHEWDPYQLDLPNNCIPIILTEPAPITRGVGIIRNLADQESYALSVLQEMYRVLHDGGRAILIFYHPKEFNVYINCVKQSGLTFMHHIVAIIDKRHTKLKQYQYKNKAKKPFVAINHISILVLYKNYYMRDGDVNDATILEEEYYDYASTLWCVKNKTEIYERALKLYSHQHDAILDPFCDLGIICQVADENNRYYIGSSKSLSKLNERRNIQNAKNNIAISHKLSYSEAKVNSVAYKPSVLRKRK